LEILEKESLEKIKDFSGYRLYIEALAEDSEISIDVQRIKDRLHEASELRWEQILRDGKAEKRVDDLVKQADIYSILADHHIWQRGRHMMAIYNLLRDVIEEGKAIYYTDEEEGKVEFGPTNLEFEKIEEICYALIEEGHIQEGIYILEAIREKIMNPLIRAMVLYYHERNESERLFLQYKKEIKKQMEVWGM
jgi:hypothetical protein